MLCKGCELQAGVTPDHTTLYLIAPLPHTQGKLRGALRHELGFFPDVSTEVVQVPLHQDSAKRILQRLARTLSAPELRACRAALVPPGEVFGLQHMASVQSLHSLIARHDTGWLADLLLQQGLYSVFQPIVHAQSPTEVFAHECLMRGRLEDGREIGAGDILGAARAADLLFHVDREARLTAIRDASRHGIKTPLFINFNPTAVYDPEFCLRTTVASAKATGIPGERFVFEVIESDSVDDVDHLLRILNYYRDAGFRVALDDLGSGFASLNLLTQLRPDFVKFDRELIRNIDADHYKQKVVRKLVELAQDLGVATVAEGIERHDEWIWLRETGIQYLQGYLFARPAAPPPAPAKITA